MEDFNTVLSITLPGSLKSQFIEKYNSIKRDNLKLTQGQFLGMLLLAYDNKRALKKGA